MKIWINNGTVEEPILFGYKKGKAIIFENASMNPYKENVHFKFDQKQFDSFYRQLHKLALEVWSDLELKEATTARSDYGEYYDKELDNEGLAIIKDTGITFYPPAPHLESNRLYRFTKAKMQTYLYDLRKHTSEYKEGAK